MKIAVIPIDNRPICYDLINDILSIDNNIELFLPKLEDMGGLTTQSNRKKILEFFNNLSHVDYLIVSLDTIAYGGLVSSRRCDDALEEIKNHLNEFKNIASSKASKILAFSSIMRISNNNINEEEKLYWADFGKKIFDWSFESHKAKSLGLEKPSCDIPNEIIEDYLSTRKRNFEINKMYLNWAEQGFFDTLIFSKDDCAKYGLNVLEAEELGQIINKNSLENVFIKTGADEIPLGLISRAITKNFDFKINPVFIEEKSIDLISKYEDISLKNCVLGQIALAGCKTDINGVTFLINNFTHEQGDLVLGDTINNIDREITFPKNNFFVADVNNANGADNNFINQLFKCKNSDFFGYCGYNTSANTIGCVLLEAIVKSFAIINNSYNNKAFKKIQFIRFLDDWGYQAIVRKYIRENAKTEEEYNLRLKEKEAELNAKAKKISAFLNFYPEKIRYSLPWNRSFEIRIEIT